MNAPARFTAIPAARSEEPLLLGMIGPPGGGKSLSSLRIAKGIQSVRGGDIVLIDTEGGRARKYSDLIPFNIVEMSGATRSDDFLEAIRAQLANNPAAIIVDSMSDEHESYLEWHDEMVPKMGNNEWAAWAKPKAARKKLISGILKIKTPLIFTFRAREKTKQDVVNGKKTVVNIGWQPVAPLEIVHTLDLTCILPPRADGVPVWHSDKIGEDFIIKLPNYLKPYIEEGKPLSEKWAQRSRAGPRAAPHRTQLHVLATRRPPRPRCHPGNVRDGAALNLEDDGARGRKPRARRVRCVLQGRNRADKATLRGMKAELEALMPSGNQSNAVE
jgi:hypothetical protein